MQTLNDVHQQFAAFFNSPALQPYAWLVSKRLAEGHICIDLNALNLLPDEQAQLENYPANDSNEFLQNEQLVTRAGGAKQPFVLHNHRLYLQRYFAYESSIVASIRQCINMEQSQRQQRMEQLITHQNFIRLLSDGTDNTSLPAEENIDWQQAAAILGVLNNFTIITGGPGTGKTTTVAKILAILYTIDPGLKVALAAPTGKAAVRMAESLKSSRIEVDGWIKEKFKTLVPATIHRLLKYVPGSPYFRHDAANPLVYDLVIVDEASMIDVALFAKLLAAIGPGTRIILLGDKDQLASVEAGSLLGDLCQALPQTNLLCAQNVALINTFIAAGKGQVSNNYIGTSENILFQHIIELKRSHRFTGEGGIGKLSRAIINSRLNEIEIFADAAGDADVAVDVTYSEALFNSFINGYVNYIREHDIAAALDKLNQLRVLCAVRDGPQGVNAINKRAEAYLTKKGLLKNNAEFYENRPIIVTRNYPELNLFNGDVGIIRADNAGVLKAWFEDSDRKLRAIVPGYITAAETVFAMTIHKSQGSEYKNVMVILPQNADQPLLTRELLYTAITRAKEKVLLQATKAAILYTAAKSVQRASGIMERFDLEVEG